MAIWFFWCGFVSSRWFSGILLVVYTTAISQTIVFIRFPLYGSLFPILFCCKVSTQFRLFINALFATCLVRYFTTILTTNTVFGSFHGPCKIRIFSIILSTADSFAFPIVGQLTSIYIIPKIPIYVIIWTNIVNIVTIRVICRQHTIRMSMFFGIWTSTVIVRMMYSFARSIWCRCIVWGGWVFSTWETIVVVFSCCFAEWTSATTRWISYSLMIMIIGTFLGWMPWLWLSSSSISILILILSFHISYLWLLLLIL